MEYHNISTVEGVGGLIDYITKSYKLAVVCVSNGSLELVLHIPTLQSLKHLWSDYLTGHLNEVAERYLVTGEVRSRLSLETVILRTTIDLENYSRCKKTLMEMTGEI